MSLVTDNTLLRPDASQSAPESSRVNIAFLVYYGIYHCFVQTTSSRAERIGERVKIGDEKGKSFLQSGDN